MQRMRGGWATRHLLGLVCGGSDVGLRKSGHRSFRLRKWASGFGVPGTATIILDSRTKGNKAANPNRQTRCLNPTPKLGSRP